MVKRLPVQVLAETNAHPGSSDVDHWPMMALLVSEYIVVCDLQAEHVLNLESS